MNQLTIILITSVVLAVVFKLLSIKLSYLNNTKIVLSSVLGSVMFWFIIFPSLMFNILMFIIATYWTARVVLGIWSLGVGSENNKN